jgi:hypothetical protein
MTRPDLDLLIEYVRRVCGKREDSGFLAPAEATIGYLYSNWVMPQRSSDFRGYVKKVAYGHAQRRYRRGEAESSDEIVHGKEKRRCDNRPLTVRQFASLIGMHHQRINEAINAGKLTATYRRGRYEIDQTDANDFLIETALPRAIREVKREMLRAGKPKEVEAFRKRIYRLQKRAASPEEILEIVRAKKNGIRT